MGEYIIKRYDCDSCMTKNLDTSQCIRMITEDVSTGEIIHKRIFCIDCYENLMKKANEVSIQDEISSLLNVIQMRKNNNIIKR